MKPKVQVMRTHLVEARVRVLAQGRTKKSPLILSEFMGISSNMAEAMQINPWNLGVSPPLSGY